MVLLLAACTGGTNPPPIGTTPSSPVDSATTTEPTGTTATSGHTGGTTPEPVLFGTVPPVNLPVPEFSEVVAMDGTARSSADLIGKPTVLWFYPQAFTGG